MHSANFASPFRIIGSITALLGVGLVALMLPWLIVRDSVGKEGPPLEGAAGAADAAVPTSGKESSAEKEGAGLILTAAPAGPRLASSAQAFTSPVPDRASVLALEERLAALSYMMGPRDGVFDAGDRAGVTAFQKVENLPRTGDPDPATLSRLDSAHRPAAAYSVPPEHLEVDVARQVVFVVRGGQVTHTLPTSTGNGKIFRSQGRRSRAVTPNGQFAITYKRNGWRRSPLGMLYRPAYFNGGIAFHGAKSVPVSPASHGCVRLPMTFADWFAQEASPVGMVVYVYGNPGQPQPAAVGAGPPPPGGPPPSGGNAGSAPSGSEGSAGPPSGSGPPQKSPPLLGGILGGS